MAGFGAVYGTPARAPVAPKAPVAKAQGTVNSSNTPGYVQANGGGVAAGGAKSVPIDYSAILKQFGPQAQAAPAVPMTNTSSANPTISAINQTQLGRANGDMNAGNLGRASDIAIRDNAENERKALREGQAGRGVTGAGLEDAGQAGISRDVLTKQTGARVGIANDAEGRRDALYGQIAGQAATDANLQDQQRAGARADQGLAFQQAQAARDSEFNMFSKVLDLFGSTGLAGV